MKENRNTVSIASRLWTVNQNRNGANKMGPMQCKLGRVASGLGVRELAELAKVSANTVSRLERGEELKASTLTAIRAAMEVKGVVFIDPDDVAGPGVRLLDKNAR